jgi:hypothetical protein
MVDQVAGQQDSVEAPGQRKRLDRRVHRLDSGREACQHFRGLVDARDKATGCGQSRTKPAGPAAQFEYRHASREVSDDVFKFSEIRHPSIQVHRAPVGGLHARAITGEPAGRHAAIWVGIATRSFSAHG